MICGISKRKRISQFYCAQVAAPLLLPPSPSVSLLLRRSATKNKIVTNRTSDSNPPSFFIRERFLYLFLVKRFHELVVFSGGSWCDPWSWWSEFSCPPEIGTGVLYFQLKVIYRNTLKNQGSQRDVVYLGWPIAPSHMSPDAGVGVGVGCGVSVNEYSCTQEPK